MSDVCHAFKSHLAAGHYEQIMSTVLEPWKALSVPVKRQQAYEDFLDSDEEPQRAVRKRLCLDDIVKHYQEHGATGTLAASVCDLVLDTGETARLCYAFPKWNLGHAVSKHGELCAALKLGLARTSDDVRRAAASVETGPWPQVRFWTL